MSKQKKKYSCIIFSHNIFLRTGLFFRPASLYHPQRDAISHIKCQKEKVKGVNSKDKLKMKKKNQLLNFTFLKNRRLRLFLIAMSVLALGIYTPLFYVVSLTIITRFIGINCDHLHIVKLGLRSSSISSLREKAQLKFALTLALSEAQRELTSVLAAQAGPKVLKILPTVFL